MKNEDSKIESKYMYSCILDKKPKTLVFGIKSKSSNYLLGIICWFANWRQYAFNASDNDIVFNSNCLKDITNFLDLLNKKHKEK